jgi:Multimeric flavodoxin WrbA
MATIYKINLRINRKVDVLYSIFRYSVIRRERIKLKIVAIIGSPKMIEQSITAKLLNKYLEAVKAKNSDIETEVILLSKKNIYNCKGCCTCTKTGTCILNDDMEHIKKSMRGADLLVFASPVHFSHVSSIFQNFIERMLLELHTFEFIGKPFVNLVTTNGSGEQDCDSYLTKMGLLMGAIKLGAIYQSNNDKFNYRNFENVVNKTSGILSGKIAIKPKMMNSLYFNSMKSIIKKNPTYFRYESEVWHSREWFDQNYKQIVKKNQSCIDYTD